MLKAKDITVDPGTAIIKKNSLTCSVLEKDDLPDGYTETINSTDLKVLIEIINSFL